MKIVMVKRWETSDGSIHETEEAASRHEIGQYVTARIGDPQIIEAVTTFVFNYRSDLHSLLDRMLND